MPSSISSSERPLGTPLTQALALLTRAAWRFVVLAAAAWSTVLVLGLRAAVPLPATTDGAVVAAQLHRAGTLTSADLVVLGDSSAVTGVDVTALGRALGSEHAESLALIGFAGPASYAAVLDRLVERGVSPAAAVVLLHRESLSLDEGTFAVTPFEHAVAGATPRRFPSVVRDTKTRLASAVRETVALPMPGAWGVMYGTPAALREHLETHHGTMIDPTRASPSGGGVYRYPLADAVARRLPALRTSLARARLHCAVFGLTPVPAGRATHDLVERRATEQRIAALLGLPATAILALPPALPETLFATSAHLNGDGREVFTQIVAREVARQDGCGR